MLYVTVNLKSRWTKAHPDISIGKAAPPTDEDRDCVGHEDVLVVGQTMARNYQNASELAVWQMWTARWIHDDAPLLSDASSFILSSTVN